MLAATLLVATASCATLESRTREALNAPGLEGTRWGLVVTTMDGRDLIAIRPDERFLPASNTKLFTVAAAFHRLGDMRSSDPSMGASVRIEPRAGGRPNVVLAGGGDATLVDAPDCQRNCLSDLADMVLANGIREVGGIVIDQTRVPYERWPPGWGQDDMVTRSGAPVSALTINSNEVYAVIRPATNAGELAVVEWQQGSDLSPITSQVLTVDGEVAADSIVVERQPGTALVRIYGRIGLNSPPVIRPIAVDDPGYSAALRFTSLLAARGITVDGGIAQYLKPLTLPDAPSEDSPVADGMEIARLLPPPLSDDVAFLMKQSQNLHAELLLRRLGVIDGDGSRTAGLAVVAAMMDEIGADRAAWDLSDGSGMSVYNRVTPRTVAKLLRWTTQQTWGEQFRATLPIGGVDGTLSRRFKGTPLEGRIFAKTGTLKGTNALSGFMLTKRGEMLIFSAYANDRPEEAGSATIVLDQALVAIAESR
ncbi:MAG: D-alanyl-D-alanine carboxypeptidase/D-alanyl-D-alanine-endopeptidase [Hyphomonadaceae bacterium]|nr:D-alanyl-D-alanine carboxypeptidase/D-alanyl-D-alanine-endopeptidase [Hyphomonadaceae bacterium]